MDLASICREFFRYVMSLEEKIESLEKEMGELSSRKDDLKAKVQVAKSSGREPTNLVKWWLGRAESLEDEATKIDVEYKRRDRCLGDCSANIWLSYDLSKRAEKKWKEATELISKYPNDELANEVVAAGPVKMTGAPLVGGASVPHQLPHLIAKELNSKYPQDEPAKQMAAARPVKMTDAPLVRKESALQQLRYFVGDEKVGIIGIHGIGGVGKTALLEKLHNEFLMEFDEVIWIRTSKSLSVDEIQKALKDQLQLCWECKTQEEIANILLSYCRKKKFMLILDGLWKHLDLQMVGIPTRDHQSGSKIILTTRIETVCDRMDAKKIKVECLAWQEAWELFQQKAGKELIMSDFQIRDYAEKLAKKCGGLPLALTAIGRDMASKATADEWKHTVASLNTKPWQVPGMDEVLERLKLSYEELHDSKLRTCLLYASLLEENSSFDKVQLINYCMGDGVTDDFYDPEEAYHTGHHLLGMLQVSSLLENGDEEDKLKMHPMIRNMVIWVECECGKQENKLLVRAGKSLEAAPDVEKWRGAARISLTANAIDTLPESPDCRELLTLFLHNNYGLAKIPGSLFQFMPSLKVLDLSYTSLRELPTGIASLIGLQHLNLRETKITSLPIELGGLINLTILLLQITYGLVSIPRGLLASLSALRVLEMYGSYAIWEPNSSEGVGVEELESLERLRVLGVTLGTVSALTRLSESRLLVLAVRDLFLFGCNGLTTIQLPSATVGRSMESLQCLRMDNCCDLEEVIIGGDEWSSLPCLQELVLFRLPTAKIVWRSRSLQNLKCIWIWNCERIEQLMDCEEERAKGDAECEPFVAFPNLALVHLEDLPEFRSLSIGGRALAFPSLRILRVKNCPKLKKLTLVTDKLVELTGERKWWDALEWENDNMRSAFRFKQWSGPTLPH